MKSSYFIAMERSARETTSFLGAITMGAPEPGGGGYLGAPSSRVFIRSGKCWETVF